MGGGSRGVSVHAPRETTESSMCRLVDADLALRRSVDGSPVISLAELACLGPCCGVRFFGEGCFVFWSSLYVKRRFGFLLILVLLVAIANS